MRWVHKKMATWESQLYEDMTLYHKVCKFDYFLCFRAI